MEISGNIQEILHHLTKRLSALRERTQDSNRILVGLAGVPGSGKSTITAALLSRLRDSGYDDVAVVPMDGFHYRKHELVRFNDPTTAFLRRGAPYTFDALRFIAAMVELKRVRVAAGGAALWLPSFDHAIQDPVDRDICISSATRIVIVEGNYVLLDQPPWSQFHNMLDEGWFLKTLRLDVKKRVARRHVLSGVEETLEAAENRAELNDLPNGDLVVANLIQPDVVINVNSLLRQDLAMGCANTISV